jgi:hypothetical protein
MKLEFYQHIFEKNTQISNFMKIPTMEAELSHVNGRTDMTTLIVIFRNFARRLERLKFKHFYCLI